MAYRRGGGGKRRDGTEAAIIEGLRKCGCFVKQCHGDGAPDLIVRFGDRWMPMEVKSVGGRVTLDQQAADYPIVHGLDEALIVMLELPSKRKGTR